MIDLAINQVKRTIPKEILHLAFFGSLRGYGSPLYSLDYAIRSEVIDGRVLIDANLVGGNQLMVPLANLEILSQDDFNHLVVIPKNLTNGRRILYPLAIQFMITPAANVAMGAAYGVGGYTGNLINDNVRTALGAFTPQALPQTTNVRLVQENTLLIYNTLYFNTDLAGALVMLEHDADMSSLKPVYAAYFFQLVEYAVQAYIYNKLIVNLDSGHLEAGQDLGVVKDIVDRYADSEATYKDYFLNTWRRVTILNDPLAKSRHIQRMRGGRR